MKPRGWVDSLVREEFERGLISQTCHTLSAAVADFYSIDRKEHSGSHGKAVQVSIRAAILEPILPKDGIHADALGKPYKTQPRPGPLLFTLHMLQYATAILIRKELVSETSVLSQAGEKESKIDTRNAATGKCIEYCKSSLDEMKLHMPILGGRLNFIGAHASVIPAYVHDTVVANGLATC